VGEFNRDQNRCLMADERQLAILRQVLHAGGETVDEDQLAGMTRREATEEITARVWRD
jgi:hypothetical protein